MKGAKVAAEKAPVNVEMAATGKADRLAGTGETPDLPNSPGVSALVEEIIELPSVAMANILQPGEEITAQYDVFFPDRFIPKWKIVLLCIITLGAYFFVILARNIQQWCYKRRFCTPTVMHFSRGKMAVTNKGRAICWTTNVTQVKDPTQKANGCSYILRCIWPALFQDPVNFSTEARTKIYNLHDVRQVTQFYNSSAACLTCCIDYACGVSLAFDSFDYFNHNDSVHLQVSPSLNFVASIKALLNDTTKVVESYVGLTTQETVIIVEGNTYDKVHDGDVHQSLDDLSRLQASVLSQMPVQPEVFVPEAGKSGLNEAAARASQWLTADRDDVQVVDDAGQVKLPKRWVPLLPGEVVVGVVGLVYKMKCFDWFLTIITLGLYYCTHIRGKKFQRSANVITNKRYIEVLINQRAGTIPTHLANFSVVIRSFMPQSVDCGYIMGKKKKVVSSLRCAAGNLTLNLTKANIAFAKSMQYCTSRGEVLNMNVAPTKTSDGTLDEVERTVLPIMGDEKMLKRLDGGNVWEPCCTDNKALVDACNDACVMPGERRGLGACSLETLGPLLFPCLPWCCTLGLQPFMQRNDMIISNKAVYIFKSLRNYPCFKCCATLDSYFVAWVPVRSMKSTDLHIQTNGSENWFRRMAYICGKSNSCCNALSSYCCPVMESSYQLKVRMGAFSFVLGGIAMNKNWNTDEDLKETRKILSCVQIGIAEDLASKASRV